MLLQTFYFPNSYKAAHQCISQHTAENFYQKWQEYIDLEVKKKEWEEKWVKVKNRMSKKIKVFSEKKNLGVKSHRHVDAFLQKLHYSYCKWHWSKPSGQSISSEIFVLYKQKGQMFPPPLSIGKVIITLPLL